MDNLLIATWRRVFIRWATGEVEPLLDTGGPFYGLTWDAEYLYIGARCWAQAGSDHVIIFDRALKKVDEYELPTNGALHQILWHGGWLYLTNTRRDRVLRWRPDTWGVIMDLGTGGNEYHVNSLWHDGTHFWAAGLHGHIWRDWELWSHVPFNVHNIYWENDILILGASDYQAVSVGGELVGLAGPVGVMQKEADRWQAYTRGLARGSGHFYVGAAAVESERVERQRGRSAVVVFDEAWQPVDVLRFEDTGGMHDLRVMGLDRAHNEVAW